MKTHIYDKIASTLTVLDYMDNKLPRTVTIDPAYSFTDIIYIETDKSFMYSWKDHYGGHVVCTTEPNSVIDMTTAVQIVWKLLTPNEQVELMAAALGAK